MEKVAEQLFAYFDELEKAGEIITGRIVLTEEAVVYCIAGKKNFSIPISIDKRNVMDLVYEIDKRIIDRSYSELSACSRSFASRYGLIWHGITFNNKKGFILEIESNIKEEKDLFWAICEREIYNSKKVYLDQKGEQEITKFCAYLQNRVYNYEEGMEELKKEQSKSR